ncbi:MAG: hypothetical protein OCD02_09955 [Spirochaetaceae bacterium]
MNIKQLMEEYSIESNDVRWYLCNNLAFSLLDYQNDQDGLTKHLESGQLEVDMYNLEDKYIDDLQDLTDRNKIDDVNIRETFNKIAILKSKRK